MDQKEWGRSIVTCVGVKQRGLPAGVVALRVLVKCVRACVCVCACVGGWACVCEQRSAETASLLLLGAK